MDKNKDEFKNLEGEITYKQSWRIAHNFARRSASLFPDYDSKKLARLFNGTIYYYHEKLGSKLTKEEASDLISNDPPVPQHYIDELNEFLNKINSEESKPKKGPRKQSLITDIMKKDLKK